MHINIRFFRTANFNHYMIDLIVNQLMALGELPYILMKLILAPPDPHKLSQIER